MGPESMPFVPRGGSGETTFGLKGIEEIPSTVKGLTMTVFAPEYTTFTKAAVLPGNEGTPGGWTCNAAAENRMQCTSDYAGALPSTAETWSWRVEVGPSASMPPEWDKTTNGAATVQAHAADGSGSARSKSMAFGIRTTPGI